MSFAPWFGWHHHGSERAGGSHSAGPSPTLATAPGEDLEPYNARFTDAAFFALPHVRPVEVSRFSPQMSHPDPPHASFSTRRARIRRLLVKSCFKGRYSGFKCSDLLGVDRASLDEASCTLPQSQSVRHKRQFEESHDV